MVENVECRLIFQCFTGALKYCDLLVSHQHFGDC